MTQTVLDTDSFNGTNGNVLSTYNANWSNLDTGATNECKICSTPGVGSDGFQNSNKRAGFTWTNDQWVELTIGANLVNANWLIAVRAQTPGNNTSGYFAGYSPTLLGTNKYGIWRFTNRVATQIKTTTQDAATGDVVNLQIVGTVLDLTVNGSAPTGGGTYDTAGDGTKYSTGNPALRLEHTVANVRAGGSWRAGSVTAAATPIPSLVMAPRLTPEARV